MANNLKPSVMKIVYCDEAFMAKRRERLPPDWWIVDINNDYFWDGPYPDKPTALHRYRRAAPHLQSAEPFLENPIRIKSCETARPELARAASLRRVR